MKIAYKIKMVVFLFFGGNEVNKVQFYVSKSFQKPNCSVEPFCREIFCVTASETFALRQRRLFQTEILFSSLNQSKCITTAKHLVQIVCDGQLRTCTIIRKLFFFPPQIFYYFSLLSAFLKLFQYRIRTMSFGRTFLQSMEPFWIKKVA